MKIKVKGITEATIEVQKLMLEQQQENQIFTNPNGPVNNSLQLNSIKSNICSNTKKTKYKSQLYQSPSPQVSIFKQENNQTHM